MLLTALGSDGFSSKPCTLIQRRLDECRPKPKKTAAILGWSQGTDTIKSVEQPWIAQLTPGRRAMGSSPGMQEKNYQIGASQSRTGQILLMLKMLSWSRMLHT